MADRQTVGDVDYFRDIALQRVKIPDAIVPQFEKHFLASGLSVDKFFSQTFVKWEYELLHGKEEVSNWSGYLAVLNQGVPASYALALEPQLGHTTIVTIPGFGTADVITLYEAGVPVEYAKALDRHGVTDVVDIVTMYLTGVPVEYATLLG
jgi:hypothetical protein